MKNEKKGFGAGFEEEGMEGARRATGIPSSSLVSGRVVNLVPDVEVPQKAKRRKFTVEYKRFILREAENCREGKQISAMLRREGLYHSTLMTWRRQAEQGELEGLSSKKRGPAAKKLDPLARRIIEQEKENMKLKSKLRKAELIIEAQKKIAEILRLDREEENLS
jgi:transposase